MTWKSIKQNQASRNHTPLNLKKAKAGGTPKADPKEVSQLKLNARNAMRQFAPNPRAVARRFDADSRSLESVPQSGERIGDAASGSAELPASTGEFSSREKWPRSAQRRRATRPRIAGHCRGWERQRGRRYLWGARRLWLRHEKCRTRRNQISALRCCSPEDRKRRLGPRRCDRGRVF